MHWSRTHDARLEAAAPRLSEDDHLRMSRFRHAGEAARFLAGTRLARVAVATEVGIPVDEIDLDRRCTDCDVPHGRPSARTRDPHSSFASLVAALDISISHTADWVAVAVAHGMRVGVDIEDAQRELETGAVAALVMHPQEETAGTPVTREDLLRTWVRKEAILKASGEGLRLPPAGIVLGHGRDPAVLRWDERPHLASVTGLSDLAAPAGLVAALATIGRAQQAASPREGGARLRVR